MAEAQGSTDAGAVEQVARVFASTELADNPSAPSKADPSPEPETPLIQRTRHLLNRRIKVELSDGRVMVGVLHCLDKQGNILIHETTEYRPEEGQEWSSGQRCLLGLVLVPLEHRVSVAFALAPGEADTFHGLDPRRILDAGPIPVNSELLEGIHMPDML